MTYTWLLGVDLGSGLMTYLTTGGVFRKWFDDVPDYLGYIQKQGSGKPEK